MLLSTAITQGYLYTTGSFLDTMNMSANPLIIVVAEADAHACSKVLVLLTEIVRT